MFLKTKDYTVWAKDTDGEQRYFIKFHGQKTSQTCEITFEVFTLYVEEFYRPLERQRNERRRHLADGEIERLIESELSKDQSYEHEDRRVTMYAVESALKMCTPIQQRRFRLYYHEGYSFVEIAKLENCDDEVVRCSVKAALKKIKKYF